MSNSRTSSIRTHSTINSSRCISRISYTCPISRAIIGSSNRIRSKVIRGVIRIRTRLLILISQVRDKKQFCLISF